MPRAGRGRAGGSSKQPLHAAGPRSRDELLAAFPEALLVTELIGQGVNSVTGDYSRGAAGFMVRGGAIAEPVAEITIASNLATCSRPSNRVPTSNFAAASTRRLCWCPR